WRDDTDLHRQMTALIRNTHVARRSQTKAEYATRRTHLIAHTRIPSTDQFARISVIPHDPEAFARAIYAELHQCDEADAELIVVEDIPKTTEWQAIGDRLKRAAT